MYRRTVRLGIIFRFGVSAPPELLFEDRFARSFRRADYRQRKRERPEIDHEVDPCLPLPSRTLISTNQPHRLPSPSNEPRQPPCCGGIASPEYVLHYDGVLPAFGIDLKEQQIGNENRMVRRSAIAFARWESRRSSLPRDRPGRTPTPSVLSVRSAVNAWITLSS